MLKELMVMYLIKCRCLVNDSEIYNNNKMYNKNEYHILTQYYKNQKSKI